MRPNGFNTPNIPRPGMVSERSRWKGCPCINAYLLLGVKSRQESVPRNLGQDPSCKDRRRWARRLVVDLQLHEVRNSPTLASVALWDVQDTSQVTSNTCTDLPCKPQLHLCWSGIELPGGGSQLLLNHPTPLSMITWWPKLSSAPRVALLLVCLRYLAVR